MAILNVDVSTIDPNEPRDYDPLPKGWYEAAITGSEMLTTRAGTGEYLKLEFTILSGEHMNRKVWANLNLRNPNQQAVEIAYKDLSAIGHSVGVTRIEDSQQLHNKPLEILVVPRAATSEFAASNDVKGYRPVGGGAQQGMGFAPPQAAQPAQPAQAQPAPAAAAGTPPPWAMGK